MTTLSSKLVLHHFACHELGYANMHDLLGRLFNVEHSLDADYMEKYVEALLPIPDRSNVGLEQLSSYSNNIINHSKELNMTGEQGRSWKPHQYLALLFTELYLDRYFDDAEQLLTDLNEAKKDIRHGQLIPDYTPDDLRTLAFQSATGSGKTLIMHAHILQYRHYLALAGEQLNNIILLTPNEQMSEQHERELRKSNIKAQMFSSSGQDDLFTTVKIIDLNKLAEKKGIKRVAVQEFGNNNLVLVDEGHLGASGKVWRERRRELARSGFTFEYSATFNQIVSKDNNLFDTYAKCLLFDYPYRQFYEDGYGKDYDISNLPMGMEDASSDMYLLGCLLTFYQQCFIYRDKSPEWMEFNLAKPLWMFLGKTVTGSSNADKETRSDIVRILNFLGWVIAHSDQVYPMLDQLLAGRSGLTDETGKDYFEGQFDFLKATKVANIYSDICRTLFHGQGHLRIIYLTTGEGELHLCTANNDPFGVVNIGDSAGLYKMLVENDNPDFIMEREMGFAQQLFATIDQQSSTVNIVIGARRFIAGWNSWRVSTIGLMHVGVGEGPEIIQMFGRGVRLKGWKMSLKRHRECEVELPTDSDKLAELETLRIFGLRANYMQTFRELLAKDGIPEQEELQLPVTWNFGRKRDLKFIRVKQDLKYEFSDERTTLPNPTDSDRPNGVALDLYSRLQSIRDTETSSGSERLRTSISFKNEHTALFNRTRIYDKILARKQAKGWHNLLIRPETIDRLLENQDWYVLYAPRERLEPTEFKQVHELEDIFTDLITEYASRFWQQRRRKWEEERIEVVMLDRDDPNNIDSYELSMDAAKTALVKSARELETSISNLKSSHEYEELNLGVIMSKIHAYQPLVYVNKDCEIVVRPIALDTHEKSVVDDLVKLSKDKDDCLFGREIFLIRNYTRGHGVSFFDDFSYYPDFIVWLKSDKDQHVVFLDPKGLSRYGQKEQRKVSLHHEIKLTEAAVHKIDPNLHLHAYILSVTNAEDIGDERHPPSHWKQQGVYFLNEPDCLRQVITHVLQP